MLLDKQWQPTYLDASASPVAPHTPFMSCPLEATGHPIPIEANTLMLLQSTFALCANLQRLCRGRTDELMLPQRIYCMLCVDTGVEETV